MPSPVVAADKALRPSIWHRSLIAAGFILVAWFYAWTNGPTAGSWRVSGQQTDYYNVLLHGFLKGHLYMDFPVAKELLACPNPYDPALRGPNVPILQDATYYNGHYYLYYGVAPLTLMAPFRLVTGADMPLSMAAVCFACGGLLVGLILWESIRERYFPEVSVWIGLAAILIVGVANPMPVLLRRTLVYELPIASGCFFGLATLLALYWSMHSQRFRIAWLVAASVCLGLAVASRLTFLFTMPILLIPAWVAWREQERREFSKLPWPTLIAAVAPIAAIGALMALYNYERFGQLAEFGTKFQVAEMFNLMTPRRFGADYIPFNLADYFLATPDLSRHFPYVYFPGSWHSPVPLPVGFWGPELVPGLLLCFPVCALAVLSVFAGRQSTAPQRSVLRTWLFAPWGLFAGTAVCLMCYYAGAVRYMVDFTPALMLCASLGLLVFESWLRRNRIVAVKVIGRVAWLGLFAVSLFVGVMFSLGVRATFRAVDPVGHARVARFFERLSFWNPRLPNNGGPVEITFRLDNIGGGQSEPLLACGAGQDSEEVFLRRSDDHHIVIGYRRGLNNQAQVSTPIAVQTGGVHRVFVDLGSLYPGSPKDAAKSGSLASLQKLRQRWMILFDGEIVLQGGYNADAAKPAGHLVFFGCDPNFDDFGKVLLTPIISVRRLPLAEAAARAANRASMGLEFYAPRDVAQGSQTLLEIGAEGAEFRVEIAYLSGARAELKFWSDGRQVAASDIFQNDGQWHRLELDQVFDDGKNAIHVRVDRAALTTVSGGRVDFRRDVLKAGWGAASTAAFTGLVRNEYSESAKPVRLRPRGSLTAVSVIFHRQKKGVSEPLLVTGRTGAGDAYEVVYLDDDQVSFRHDHWGSGIVRTSPPIKMRTDFPHRIVFDFAHANPRVDEPGNPKNGTVHMTVDGQPVWEKDVAFHSFTDDEIYLGRNPIGVSTCDGEFSGEIISYDVNAAPETR